MLQYVLVTYGPEVLEGLISTRPKHQTKFDDKNEALSAFHRRMIDVTDGNGIERVELWIDDSDSTTLFAVCDINGAESD